LEERAARSLVPVPAAGWRNVGRPLHADLLTDAAGTLAVRATTPEAPALSFEGDAWRAVGAATRAPVQAAAATSARAADDDVMDLTTEADGMRRRYRVRQDGHRAFVNGPEGQSTFALRAEDDPDDRGGEAGECRAPLPGAVTKVLVAVGDAVVEGDGLLVLEAMKMEHTLRADGAGTVSEVRCEPGQQVDVGDLLVALEPS
jgi:propionyl-CoA carboxylase alpha chain